jgi:hypothetical protein
MSNRIPFHAALRTFLFILLTFAVTCTVARSATKAPWDSVSPEDLAAKDSKSFPGADAEILLSFSDFDYIKGMTTIDHALVTKIYTQKGVEDRGKSDIDLAPWEDVEHLKAKVLKPDGRVLNLKKEDFLETVQLKYEGEKWKKVAFAFPDLGPGDIIVTSWTVDLGNYYYARCLTYCQGLLPVRLFQLKISSFPRDYVVEWLNCTGELSSKDSSSMSLTVQNLPAFVPEDFMGPEQEYRGSVSIVGNNTDWDRDRIWAMTSATLADKFSGMTKPGNWKTKATELTANATSDEEKLQRLYDFCQREIVNYSRADTAAVKTAGDKHLEDDDTRSGAGTLKKGQGTSFEINLAFAALARGAGCEVKRAESASREEVLNIATPSGWTHLDRMHVAVKVAGKWKFFDPGNYWAPYGMLGWTDEMVTTLLCDKEKLIFETTPVTAANLSPVERRGRFGLNEEGTLQGEVDNSFGGHEGMELKEDNWEKTIDETNKDLVKGIVDRLPTAEVTEIRWKNLRTREYPVTVHYKVLVPGYAEPAGSRLTFVANYFEAGRPAIFTAASRKFPIFFPFAYQQHDDIEIALPEHFQLDHPGAPGDVGDLKYAFGATYNIEYLPKKKLLHYTRTFEVGGNGMVGFQSTTYPAFQKMFSQLRLTDNHSLIIRSVDATLPAPPAEPAKSPATGPAKGGTP